MKHSRIALALSALFAFTAVAACTPDAPSNPTGGDVTLFAQLPEIPFCSFLTHEDSGVARIKMKATWTDSYNVNFSKKVLSGVKLYDETGKLLIESEETFDIDLTAGQVVLAELTPVNDTVRINVTAKENKEPQPFEIAKAPDPASFETTSADPTVDPLKAAELTYVKRPDTLYVYSNAPETLTPEAVNKCITRQDVSNQSVYFTYEHQSTKIVNEGITDGVYYGYRVTNTGNEDMYVTVKNLGLQLAGGGAFLGEQEWVDFYNVNFPVKGLEDFSAAQMANYKAYFNFDGNYVHKNFQPTTYRVPAGEFIYVIGGTTKDAYGNYSVGGTADRSSKLSEVTNGAVLFDVVGKAEGAFYIYDDIDAVNKGGAGYDTHVGVADMANPRGSVGMEEGYVVDGSATWTFNDATPSQTLPVNFTNYYNADLMGHIRGIDDNPDAIKALQKQIADFLRANYPDSVVSANIAEDGSIIPCSPIPDGKTPHEQKGLLQWATHSDAQHYVDAVGTDITIFHTVYSGGTDKPLEDIQFGLYNFSTQGIVLEMGNWMKDYQDLFTFVNQGNQPRTVRIHIRPNGGLASFFRDMDGKVIPGTAKSALQRGGGLNPFYNAGDPNNNIQNLEGFDLSVDQEFTIPAHTVFQVVAEYNLMANSYGNVTHWVELI